LFNLIAVEEQRDMLVSLVEMSKQGGGWLPRWPSGNGYTNSMLGTPADMVITESYLKGIQDFDVESAYQAMRLTALEPTPSGASYSGREGITHYLEYGYCPAELMEEAVSRTMEFAYADHAISLLADTLGYLDDVALFSKHAQFYKYLWNPETRYFQPRDTLGQFVEQFKPLLLTYLDWDGDYTNDYVEGSALQWRWAVPFDPQGLIALFKDREYFINELNQFFAQSDPTMGAWNPGPYYWHGNEPDIHAAYLFNDAGRPDLTQKWVHWIRENKYGLGHDGLDGNDDGGTLSAWYIFSALGFYPIAGTDIYQLGSPLFKEAELNLGKNRLTIIADNVSKENIFVEKVWLNDILLDRTWFKHAEIADGGIIRFKMSNKP
jgi:predicted alpha-1,2-mannosidase